MLNVSFDQRPPYVRFEEREYGLNPEASTAAGRPIPRVVLMACITPFASKDCFEKPATEWLEDIRRRAAKGEYPAEWAQRFTMQYEEHLKGNELPREGTPVQTWQMVTAEQRMRLKALGVGTVEDLAMTPDSGLSVIGLDGRTLRDTAKSWIAEAKDKGIVSRALADANAKLEQQQVLIDRLSARLESAEAGIIKRGPGRPRNNEAA